MAMYWLIATPNEGKGSQENRRILDETSAKKKLSDNFLFDIPQLKVGTIDNLMALSDELSKYDVLVGGTAKKIERAYIDTWKAEPTENEAENKEGKVSGTAKAPELKVNDVSPQEFVEQFKWNAVRYPNKRATLRAMVETIVKDTSKTDAELKKFTTEFNEIRNTVSALERKETGTLMVRPLGPYVQKQHVVESDFLSTLMLVVPKVKEIEFLQQYEMFEDLHKDKEAKIAELRLKEEQLREAKNAELKTAEAAASGAGGEKKRDTSKPVEIPTAAQTIPKEVSATDRATAEEKRLNDEREKKRSAIKNIVPRSAIKLAEDTEFVLYRVVVLKKGVELYKTICRERRITVRDFKYDPAQDEMHKKNMENLEKHKKKQWRNLVLWCKTTFSEVFSAWIHIKAMRTFVEAVLRYGLPVDFTATLMLPAKGQEKRLRETLKALYGKLASANLTQQLDSAEADLSGLGQDFYPYVYLTINLAEAP